MTNPILTNIREWVAGTGISLTKYREQIAIALDPGYLSALLEFPWVNVLEFGADPTGINDSTAAVQSAIDFLTPTGGVVLFPVGTYLLGTLTTYDNIKFTGMWNSILKMASGGTVGFNVTNTSDVSFDNLIFDCSLQHGATGYAIYTNTDGTVSNFTMTGCKLKDGHNFGVILREVTNCKIINCEGSGFDQWPLYIQSGVGIWVVNGKWYSNGTKAVDPDDGVGDGIKIAGVDVPADKLDCHDVFIYGNLCYDNGRDGIDLACNNMDRIHIFDNICYNNGAWGIDFKTAYQSLYARNGEIHSNHCMNNGAGGINCLFYEGVLGDYPGTRFNRLRVHDNICYDSTSENKAGMQLLGVGSQSEVYNNFINGFEWGVFIVDCYYTKVSNNYIDNCTHGAWVSYTGTYYGTKFYDECASVRVESNDFFSITEYGIEVIDTDTVNTMIRWNRFGGTLPTQTVQLPGGDTTSIVYQNYRGYGTSIPTGNGFKGDIVLNSSSDAGEYTGWICVTTGTPGTWKGFGAIAS